MTWREDVRLAAGWLFPWATATVIVAVRWVRAVVLDEDLRDGEGSR